MIVGVIHNGDLLRIICLMYFDVGHRLVDMYTYQKSNEVKYNEGQNTTKFIS